jgi:hypothetical protein
LFTLLKILIFGGATVLNTQPVDIGEKPLKILLAEPVSAITPGASINISLGDQINSEDVFSAFEEISEKYPKGCVSGTLHSADGKQVQLNHISGRWNDEGGALNLSAAGGLPTDMKYVSLDVLSCRRILGTTITWYNYST